jgi:hypothetical protein
MTKDKCPFCGGTNLETTNISYEYGDTGVDYRVHCKTCDAYGPSGLNSPERASQLWEKRSKDG